MANENSGDADKVVQAGSISQVHFHDHHHSTGSVHGEQPDPGGGRRDTAADAARARRRNVTVALVLSCVCGSAIVAAPFVVPHSSPSHKPNLPPVGNLPAAGAAPPVHGAPSPGTPPVNEKCRTRLPGAPARLDGNKALVNIARQEDGTVVRSNGARDAWVRLLGDSASPPVLALDGRCQMAGFVVDNKHTLQFNPDVESGAAPEKWEPLVASGVLGTPAVTQDSLGKLVVVFRTVDGALREVHQDLSAARGWSAPQQLEGPAVKDDPAVYQDPAGLVRVFALSQMGTVRTQVETHPGSDQWSRVTTIPGFVESTPSVTENFLDGNRLELFSRGANGSLRQNLETRAGSNGWQGWQTMPSAPNVRFTGEPITVWDANNRVVVFAKDERGALWEAWQVGSRTLSDWQPHGGPLRQLLTATLDSGKKLVVHGIDNEGDLDTDYQRQPATRPWDGLKDKIPGGNLALD